MRTRNLTKCLFGMSLLMPWLCGAVGPTESLITSTAAGKQLVIRAADGSCRLGDRGVQRQIGLIGGRNAAQPSAAGISVFPAFAVPARPSSEGKVAPAARLVIVDLACHETKTLLVNAGQLNSWWYSALAEAVNLGYMDTYQDGKWGSINLRSGAWDPEPCCSNPPHSLIRLAWQREHERLRVSSGPPSASQVWDAVQPAVWVHAALVMVCFLVALGRGIKGGALAGEALIVLPLKAVSLVAAVVVMANLYALAGLLRSGGLEALAIETYSSATRAWRR